MNKLRAGEPAGTSRFGFADWLCLAAAPTFAAMGLATILLPNSDMMCSMGQGPLSLTGMAPMYLLMSAFHLAPWLRLWR